MKKTIVLVMIIAVVSKFIGLLRDVFLSYFFGASSITDAYLVSLSIPFLLVGLIVSGFGATFIPLYGKYKLENEEKSLVFTSSLINHLLLFSLIILVPSLIFTKEILSIVASGFEGEALEMAVKFTRISLLTLFGTSISIILKAFLEVNKKFFHANIVMVFYDVVVIISIFLGFRFNLILLPIGALLASYLKVVYLLVMAKKTGFSYSPKLKFISSEIKVFIFLAFPIMLGNIVAQISFIVTQSIASLTTEGGISALSYAHKIDSSFQGIIIFSSVAVLYPRMTERVNTNDFEGLKTLIKRSIIGVNILLIPAAIGMMLFSSEIITIVFGRGAFNEDAVYLTSIALFFYAIAMPAIGVKNILLKTFYSIRDTKTPMIAYSVTMSINILLSFLLVELYGIGGLALASSISIILFMIILILVVQKKVGLMQLESLIIPLFKIIIATVLMAVVSVIVRSKTFYLGLEFSFLITIFSAVLSFGIILYLLRLREFRIILTQGFNYIGKKFRGVES